MNKMNYLNFSVPFLFLSSFVLNCVFINFCQKKEKSHTIFLSFFTFFLFSCLVFFLSKNYLHLKKINEIDVSLILSLNKPTFSLFFDKNGLMIFSFSVLVYFIILFFIALDKKLSPKMAFFSRSVLDLYLLCLYFVIFNENIFGKFIYLEIITILSVVLIWKSSARNNISGLFYIITHGVSGLTMLIGLSGLFYFLNQGSELSYGAVVSKLILQLGFLVAIGLLPFSYFIINAYAKAKKFAMTIVVACYSKIVCIFLIKSGYVYESYSLWLGYLVIFTSIYCFIYALLEKDLLTSFFYQNFAGMFVFVFYFFEVFQAEASHYLINYFSYEMLHSAITYIIIFQLYNTLQVSRLNINNLESLNSTSTAYLLYTILLMTPFLHDINLVNEIKLHELADSSVNVNLAFLVRNLFYVFWAFKLFAIALPKIKTLKYSDIQKDLNFYAVSFFVFAFVLFSLRQNLTALPISYVISLSKDFFVYLLIAILFAKPLKKSSLKNLLHIHHIYLKILIPVVLGILKAISFINYAFVEYFYRTRKTIKNYVDIFLFKNHFTQDNVILNVILVFIISILIILATQYHEGL